MQDGGGALSVSQYFTIRTDPKPVNNVFIFFFPAVNWLTSGFVYTTLSLNQLTSCLQSKISRGWHLCTRLLFQSRSSLTHIQQVFAPGGGDSYMEQTGMLVGNFEFNPERRPSGCGMRKF